MFGSNWIRLGGDIGRGVDFGQVFGPDRGCVLRSGGCRPRRSPAVGEIICSFRGGRPSAAGGRLIKARRLAAVVKLCSGAQETEVEVSGGGR